MVVGDLPVHRNLPVHRKLLVLSCHLHGTDLPIKTSMQLDILWCPVCTWMAHQDNFKSTASIQDCEFCRVT